MCCCNPRSTPHAVPYNVRCGASFISPERAGGLEALDEFRVGGGEFVGGESFACDPGEGVAMNGLGFARDKIAMEEAEADRFFGIGVGDFFDLFSDRDLDAEFFAEFADEAVLEGFVRLDLTTREFPEEAEVIVRSALGDEKFAGAEDEAGGDIDDLAHSVESADQRPMLL